MFVRAKRIHINIADRSAFCQYHFIHTCPAHINSIQRSKFVRIRIFIVAQQFHHFISVQWIGQIRTPAKISPFVLKAQRQFDTFIIYTTAIDYFRFIAGSRRKGTFKELIVGTWLIDRSIQSQTVLEEDKVKSGFPWFGTFRLQIGVRTSGLSNRNAINQRISRNSQKYIRWITYFRIRNTYFHVWHNIRTATEYICDNPRKTDRRIEERTGIRPFEGRWPVVTSRHIQISHRLVTDLSTTEYGAFFQMIAILVGQILLWSIHVAKSKEVGYRLQFASEIIRLIIIVFKVPTHISCYI